MLILTRHPSQSVIITIPRHDEPDEILTVLLLSVKGFQVRLGFDASKSISVHREEVYRRIQQQNQQAQDYHATYADLGKIEDEMTG